MPTQVIVVKRSRRSLFAVPRSLPDWLRSLWAARSPRWKDESAGAPESARAQSPADRSGAIFPRLTFDSQGAHRCVGCDLCVRLCPSRCMNLTVEGEDAALVVTGFEVMRASCIGCGVCRDVCPENAIEMSGGPNVELVIDAGRMSTLDLLATNG